MLKVLMIMNAFNTTVCIRSIKRNWGFKFVLSLLFFIPLFCYSQPKSLFSSKNQNGCAPLAVTFNNLSQGAKSYLWILGNGNQSNRFEPTAIYNSAGTYNITLIATDSIGQSDTFTQVGFIHASKAPKASFTTLSQNICLGDTAKFIDNSILGEAPILYHVFDLGNGDTSFGNPLLFKYPKAGQYDITYAIEDGNGCKSTLKRSRYMKVNSIPSVTFNSPNRYHCSVPTSVQFTSEVNGYGTIKYFWNFDSSIISNLSSPVVQYLTNGKKSVGLTIIDGNGCKNSLLQKDFIWIQAPEANFTFDKTVICLNETIQFNNQCQPWQPNMGDSVLWSFGDGTFSTLSNPTHKYTQSGDYTVSLLYYFDGCKSQKIISNAIHVKLQPAIKIQVTDSVFCRKSRGIAILSIIGNNYSLPVWKRNNFPPSPLDSQNTFSFPLDSTGLFKISITVKSELGCGLASDSITIRITGPKASIKSTQVIGCMPYNGILKSLSTGTHPIVAYNWSSKDLNLSGNSKTLPFTNTKYGKSQVYLTVTDSRGCTDVFGYILQAGKIEIASFKVDKKIYCNNEPITVYNHSLQKHFDSVIFLWNWNKADPLPLLNKDTSIIKFRTVPSKNVKLTFLSSSFGCISKDSAFIDVLGPLLDANMQLVCEKDSLYASNLTSYETKTYWRYKVKNQVSKIDTNKLIKTAIFSIEKLWLFAFNDSNQCKDSLLMNLNIDPILADFDLNIQCNLNNLSTTSHYHGLKNDNFTWIIEDINTAKVLSITGRELKDYPLVNGQYSIKLSVNNAMYSCTKSVTKYFTISDFKNLTPTVSIVNSKCFPIELKLKDPYYKLWTNAKWVIDEKYVISDTIDTIITQYSGINSNIWVRLSKTDSQGCIYSDSFELKVGGPQAEITSIQNNSNCDNPVLSFFATNHNAQSGTNYTYDWDFGSKKSKLFSDTLHVRDSATFNVKLTITADNGCTSSVTKLFQIKSGRPIAKFYTGSKTTASCPPLTLSFIDTSIGKFAPIAFYRWDFGDSTSSTKQNPDKMYVIPGKFSVRLIVTNSILCSDTMLVNELAHVKGPTGTYKVDKYKGCAPLKLHYNISHSKDVVKNIFDFGEGMISDSLSGEFTYLTAGNYIPRLLLTDSAGCSFSPETFDTIHVFELPVAHFNAYPVCKNSSHFISHQSTSADNIKEIIWSSKSKFLSHKDSFKMLFGQKKITPISLVIETVNGCKDSTSGNIIYYDIKATMNTDKAEHCLGDKIQLNDLSVADTTIVARNIWLDSVEMPYNDLPYYFAKTRGKIDLKFEITDILGCKSNIAIPAFLKVGDTTQPIALQILRSTVLNDLQTGTLFRASIESDFKDYTLMVLKNLMWIPITKTEILNDTNLTVSGLNTLLNSYCHRIIESNFCGVKTDTLTTQTHCTVEAHSTADTNKSNIGWTAYKGWTEVAKYWIWRKITGTPTYKLLDSVEGNILTYKDTSTWCHTKYDYKIESTEQDGNFQISSSDTTQCLPIHLVPVIVPEIWRTTVNNSKYTHTEWIIPGLSKYPIGYFDIYKIQGKDSTKIQTQNNQKDRMYDDYNTAVNEQSYTYLVKATDVCNSTSNFSEPAKSIWLKVIGMDVLQNPTIQWTPYEFWNEGVATYTVERSISGGGFTVLYETNGNVLSFTDYNLPEYCENNFQYRVTALRNQPLKKDSSFHVTSVSNDVQFVPEMKFFIPNAFTPNQNNLNEVFRPIGKYFSHYEMKIYNRYGEKVYDGNTCLNAWDGRYMDEMVQDGLYAYHITALDMGGKAYNFNGSIHLLR